MLAIGRYVSYWNAFLLYIDLLYRSGTVYSKSFVGKDFLRNKWKYKLNYAL